mmetsp:Transcript_20289/g.51863  ORF Transcript_20289/g.51863 Transcript_20289/m.51863 type:complete len:94 (-) Transcript_20289:35-316(-)
MEVLRATAQPYELERVDIEAKGCEDWHGRYWMDIPVFHLEGCFWAKHRLDAADIEAALSEAATGSFRGRPGEPDAARDGFRPLESGRDGGSKQ